MIGISTTTGNSDGAVIIYEKPDSETENYPARVQRHATLDGGAVITHLGFAHGDRTLRVQADITETTAERLKNIHQTETSINISIKDGFFSGAIDDLNINGGQLDMTILIESKLSS